MTDDDSRTMADALNRNRQSLKLFEGLDRGILEDMARSIESIQLEEGRTLFRQGDAADAMYMVQEGMLHAYVAEEGCAPTLVGRMGPGALVGEIALLMGGRRNATVVAAERTRMARLGAREADVLVARNPEMKRGMLDLARRRLRRTQWLKILPAYFGEIDREKYEFIEPRFEWVHLDRGGTLFSKGDAADCMYFLVHGLLHVVATDAVGEQKSIGAVFRGEIVGEMAILSGERRTASVCAVRDSDLVRLTKDGFEEINKAYPGVSMAILRILVQRLKERDKAPRRSSAVNIALVPAGPGVPLSEFSRRLHEALSCTDKTALLGSARLAAEFSSNAGIAQAADDDPLHIGLVTWLEELESGHDFVLYEADPQATPWTQRCIRQADRVLIVGRAGDDPAPGRIETEWLLGKTGITTAARTVVLIHPDGSVLPSATMEWLSGRRPADHQHVRWDRDADFSRLARIVSRRAVGLVLGGGGARGMAHLGVLRALEERGIPVDMVGGASIGAILGGACAMGMDTEALAALCRRTFQQNNPFNDYTIPIVSLLASRKIEKAARGAYGDARIEDLWLTFFCVSTNLASCDVKVHADGPLWEAARASSSLPGIFQPVVQDGAVHVDGGVMNNLPGDIMRQRAGIVITVDVDSREDMTPGFSAFPSPWKILRSRLLPWRRPIASPNVAEIMMATIMTGCRKSADAVKADADLSLEPPVQGIGVLDFKNLDRTAQGGYEHALARIDALPADAPLRTLFGKAPRAGAGSGA